MVEFPVKDITLSEVSEFEAFLVRIFQYFDFELFPVKTWQDTSSWQQC